MKRWNRGTTRDVHLPREGYTKEDQEHALAECKAYALGQQDGWCSTCDKPMKEAYTAWVSNRNGKPLRKWARGESHSYDPVNLRHVYQPRSPEEIHAEFARGNGGHELVCIGCVRPYNIRRFGTAGTGKAFIREYEALIQEQGWSTEHLRANPALIVSLWAQTKERLAEKGKAHLAKIGKKGLETLRRNDPEWGTGAWRTRRAKKKPDRQGARPFDEVKDPDSYRTTTPSNGFHRPTEAEKQVIRDAADAEMDTPFARHIEALGQEALRRVQEQAQEVAEAGG